MDQATSLRERRHGRRLLPTLETCGSSAVSVGTRRSILDSNRFEQGLCNALAEQGLQVISNIGKASKQMEAVQAKWSTHRDELNKAGLDK